MIGLRRLAMAPSPSSVADVQLFPITSQEHSPAEDVEKRSSDRPSRRHKRPRLVLSCTECVRRKTKCDRHHPCAACIKRGNPIKCHVDEVDEVPAQPFALAQEHLDLKRRVAFLEEVIKQQNPSLTFPYSPLKTTFVPGHDDGSPGPHDPRARRSVSVDSGTEIAAMTLEMIALGKGKDQDVRGSAAEEGSATPDSLRTRTAEDTLNQMSHRSPFISVATADERNQNQLYYVAQDVNLHHADFACLRSVLPSRPMSTKLIESYIERVDFTYHIMHYPSFAIELDHFWMLVDSDCFHQVDPAWLAQYLMVACIGMLFLPADPQVTPQQQADLPPLWFAAAQKALNLADWTGKPQLRCVSAILLFLSYLINIGEVERLIVWVSSAYRIAQILGLHKLDESNNRIPNDPLAYASGPPLLKREMGKRLFWMIVYIEWNVTDRSLGIQGVRPTDFTTSPPKNYEDEDLMLPNPVELALDQPTRVCYEIWRIGLLSSHQQWQIDQGRGSHSYQTVIDIDNKLHGKIAQLPKYYHPDHVNDPEVRVMDQQKPWLPLQRCVVNLGLHNRIMRLHRPYLTKACKDKHFELSARRCVHSARMVLESIRIFRSLCDSCDKFWFVCFYTFSAALVLLVHNLAARISVEEICSHHQEIMAALGHLKLQERSSVIAKSGVKVLEGLLQEHSRQLEGSVPSTLNAHASNASPSWDDGTHIQQVLNRMVKQVSEVAVGGSQPMNRRKSTTQPHADTFPPLPTTAVPGQASTSHTFMNLFSDNATLITQSPLLNNTTSLGYDSLQHPDLFGSLGFHPPPPPPPTNAAMLTSPLPWLSLPNVGVNDVAQSGLGSSTFEDVAELGTNLTDLGWIDGLGGTV